MTSIDDRTTYIGGPAAATILGVNPWQTPLALWQELTGRAERMPTTDVMRAGLRLEPAVLAFAADELGTEVLPGPFLRDPALPLGGHLDGITKVGDVVEAKTARSRNGWGEPGTGEIPPVYAAQCLHYMGLSSAGVAWVPVLFSGLEFALYRVERDEKLIQFMRDLCAFWWEKHIVADMPPEPTTGADAARLFPRDSGKVVIADDATVAAVARLHEVRDSIKTLGEEEELLVDRIKLCMRDASVLAINGEAAATWRTTKPSLRFDQTAFKQAQPELYSKFCREQSSRRFLLKDAQ